MTDPADLPTGTVTFLFTDLEGSTALLQAHPAAYREAVRRHHALLRDAAAAHRGAVFETVGDAVYAAFAQATDAVGAALAGQLALRGAAWGETGPLAVRMGLHTGEAERQGGHYLEGITKRGRSPSPSAARSDRRRLRARSRLGWHRLVSLGAEQ